MTTSFAARRLPVFVAALAMAGFAGWKVLPDRVDFLEQPDALSPAVEKLVASAGSPPRVLKILVEGSSLAILAPEADDPAHFVEWRYTTTGSGLLGFDNVIGPTRQPGVRAEAADDLFAPAEIDFAAARAVIAAAKERAALPGPVNAARIEIARRVYGLAPRTVKPLRWSIEVRGPRDSVRVQADEKGGIRGANSGFARKLENLDLPRNEEMLSTAARSIHGTLRDEPVILRLVVDRQGVSVHTNRPEASSILSMSGSLKSFAAWTWTPAGLRRGLGQIGLDGALSGEISSPFAVGDVNWPKLMESAREAAARLAMPEGVATEIEARKFDVVAAAPPVGWKVRVADRDGERGWVLFGGEGEVLHVEPPESRQTPIDWRDPPVMIAALARMAREFGPEAKFTGVNFSRDGATLTASDPRNPGEFATFSLSREGFSRAAINSMFAARATPFTLAELWPLTAEKIAELENATTTRLGLPEKSITSVAIGKASMDPSPTGAATVEIRAEERPFGRAGRINYELDGRPIKVYMP